MVSDDFNIDLKEENGRNNFEWNSYRVWNAVHCISLLLLVSKIEVRLEVIPPAKAFPARKHVTVQSTYARHFSLSFSFVAFGS